MDQAKLAGILLPDEGNRGNIECGCKRRKMIRKPRLRLVERRAIETPGQGQMKAEVFTDIRIAPFKQIGILPRREPRPPTPRDLGVIRRAAVSVEVPDKGECQSAQSFSIAGRNEGEKPANPRQPQATRRYGRRAGGERREICGKVVDMPTVGQTERRFQCPVEPVFAGRSDYGRIACTRQSVDALARLYIPSQPTCTELGQTGLVRQMVNRVSLET